MTELRGHLHAGALRVLEAATTLHSSAKRVWAHDYFLDQGPEGAYLASAKLAQRLGLSVSSVEKIRRVLVLLGLHQVRRGADRRGDHWFAVMPADCVPTDKGVPYPVVFELAARLDGWIEARALASSASPFFGDVKDWVTHREGWVRPTGGGATDPPEPVPLTHRRRQVRPTGNGAASAPAAGGASLSEGGVGGGAPTSRESERLLSPQGSEQRSERLLTQPELEVRGEMRVREKRGGAMDRLDQLLDRWTHRPPRVAGES